MREVVGSVGRWNKDFEVERFDLPPLRGGGRRGELLIVGTAKLWEISLLGCLYVGCVGCGAARSLLLLFGYVVLYCVATLLICTYFLPLPLHRGLPQRSSDRVPPAYMASVRGVEGRGAFLREVVGSVGRWKKDFEVERFDLPPLRGGGRRENYSSSGR